MNYITTKFDIKNMYLLFAYNRYYPEGASNDFVCKYSSFKECLEQIIDTSTLKPKTSFTWNEIYDVARDDWHIFYVNKVKDGAEYFVEIEYTDPDGDTCIVDEALISEMFEML